MHNRGGAYIIAELDGSVLDRPIAAFRVIPYLARRAIKVRLDMLDVPLERVRELEESEDLGDDEEDLLDLDDQQKPAYEMDEDGPEDFEDDTYLYYRRNGNQLPFEELGQVFETFEVSK